MADALNGWRVLVAEDEPLIAMNLAIELEAEGAIIVGPTATLGDAMEIIARAAIDAAVLDIQLGKQLVYPLADALAAKGVPFVFATGGEIDDIPLKYLHMPRCEKPFDTKAVLKALISPIARSLRQLEVTTDLEIETELSQLSDHKAHA